MRSAQVRSARAGRFLFFLMTIYIIGDPLPPSAHPHATPPWGWGWENNEKKKLWEKRLPGRRRTELTFLNLRDKKTEKKNTKTHRMHDHINWGKKQREIKVGIAGWQNNKTPSLSSSMTIRQKKIMIWICWHSTRVTWAISAISSVSILTAASVGTISILTHSIRIAVIRLICAALIHICNS